MPLPNLEVIIAGYCRCKTKCILLSEIFSQPPVRPFDKGVCHRQFWHTYTTRDLSFYLIMCIMKTVCIHTYIHTSRLTVVSREAKNKHYSELFTRMAALKF